MAAHREFDVCELSMATFLAMLGTGDRSLVAVPAFPHRRFRWKRGNRCGSSRWASARARAPNRVVRRGSSESRTHALIEVRRRAGAICRVYPLPQYARGQLSPWRAETDPNVELFRIQADKKAPVDTGA